MDDLLNQETGEVIDAQEHFAKSRGLARDLERLDRAIADNKSEGKDLKDEREQLVKQLRAHVRDVGVLEAPHSSRKARKR